MLLGIQSNVGTLAHIDVFIDYVNFFTILRPGGVMAVDDLQVPAVKSAFVAFCKRYGLTPTREKTQVRRKALGGTIDVGLKL